MNLILLTLFWFANFLYFRQKSSPFLTERQGIRMPSTRIFSVALQTSGVCKVCRFLHLFVCVCGLLLFIYCVHLPHPFRGFPWRRSLWRWFPWMLNGPSETPAPRPGSQAGGPSPPGKEWQLRRRPPSSYGPPQRLRHIRLPRRGNRFRPPPRPGGGPAGIAFPGGDPVGPGTWGTGERGVPLVW